MKTRPGKRFHLKYRNRRFCRSFQTMAQNGHGLTVALCPLSICCCRGTCANAHPSRTCTMCTSAAGSSLKRRHAQLHVNCQCLFSSPFRSGNTMLTIFRSHQKTAEVALGRAMERSGLLGLSLSRLHFGKQRVFVKFLPSRPFEQQEKTCPQS